MSLLSDTETPAPALTRAGGHWSGGGGGGVGGGNHISAGLSLNYCLLSPSNRQDGALPSQ